MKTPQIATSGSLHPIVGRRWRAVVNGKTAMNGALYSVQFDGDISEADEDKGPYDAISCIAEELKAQNAEMEIIHSMQITLGSPPNASDHPTAS